MSSVGDLYLFVYDVAVDVVMAEDGTRCFVDAFDCDGEEPAIISDVFDHAQVFIVDHGCVNIGGRAT